jgi:hypothetical protein
MVLLHLAVGLCTALEHVGPLSRDHPVNIGKRSTVRHGAGAFEMHQHHLVVPNTMMLQPCWCWRCHPQADMWLHMVIHAVEGEFALSQQQQRSCG